LKRKWKRSTYRKQVTSSDLRVYNTSLTFARLIDIPKTDELPLGLDVVSRHYLNHRFDLLGSGWVHNAYETKALGLESYRYDQNLNVTPDAKGQWLSSVVSKNHVKFSRQCWSMILDLNPDYTPIDWQKDFKSGFRWSAQDWFHGQGKKSQNKLGVDIKVPWELSRLQHLPQLAIYAQYEDLETRKTILEEIICQILDFIMVNPIGMGVNFNCPMDIGIRNANLLLTLDFLMPIDDSDVITRHFIDMLLQYIAASTIHILEDIEYREGLTSNHYLGNVLGILFAGAYIESHKEADRWLSFGIQELQRSMDRQFFHDGSNFEGSTSYHRLSGEMMVWGAMVSRKAHNSRKDRLQQVRARGWKYEAPLFDMTQQVYPNEDFLYTSEFWSRLIHGGKFSQDITKPDGTITQFGDNDSGRFIKLQPIGQLLKSPANLYLNLQNGYTDCYGEDVYWDENNLNHAGYISSIAALRAYKPIKVQYAALEHQVFSKFADEDGRLQQFLANVVERKTETFERSKALFVPSNHEKRSFEFERVDFHNDLNIHYYPDFQIIIIKNNDLFLSLAGISNPNQHHSLGHTHNDKLSVELQVAGKDILLDAGTYVYTPLPDLRNTYRSAMAHSTITVRQEEQNTALPGNLGLFNLKPEVRFKLHALTKNEILSTITYRDIIHNRKISILKNSIVIEDWCNHSFEQHFNTGKPYSNGYGKRIG